MQCVGLWVAIEQFVGDVLVMGALGEVVEQLRSAAAAVEPLHRRRRIGNFAEDGDQWRELIGNAEIRVAERCAEFYLESVVGGLVSSSADPGRGFGELGFEDLTGVAARKTHGLVGVWVRWMGCVANHARLSAPGAASYAEIRLGSLCGAIDPFDFTASTAPAVGPAVAGLADRAVVGVRVGGSVVLASNAGALRGAVAVRAERGTVAAAGLDRQYSPTLSTRPSLARYA